MPGTNDAKRELRRTMRDVRRAAVGDERRSAAIVERLAALPCWRDARIAMLFEPVTGEPDVLPLVTILRRLGVDVVVPDPRPNAPFPVRPDRVDVVVVPGLAFARDGRRLGQGGGWYDRFLAGVGPGCVTIGVCFDEQLVDDVPVDAHDIAVRCVVTPSRTLDVDATGARPDQA